MNPQPLALETKVLPIELPFLILFMRKLQLSIYYLQELNYRLIYAVIGTVLLFLTTYNYKQAIIFIILPRGLSHFVSAGLTEIFFTYMQLCTILSFSFSLLLMSIQIYLFLRPGLFKFEASISLKFLILAIFFYFFIYTLVFPALIKLLWQLFSTHSQHFAPINLTFEPRLNDYLKNIQQLNQLLSLSFPCLLILSLLQGYTQKTLWIKHRGIAYIVAFIIAAFITPPDILSLAIVGAPLVAFYELQIILWALYREYQGKLLIRKPIK